MITASWVRLSAKKSFFVQAFHETARFSRSLLYVTNLIIQTIYPINT
jgi:hypothetical protein